MATSPYLIAAFVEALGEPKAVADVALKRLRTAELIPVRGRGPFAAQMDFQAAMRMLLAICASVPLERDANVLAVERFERLLGHLDENATLATEGWDPAGITLPLDQLDDEHTLGDAIIAILKTASEGDLYLLREAGKTPFKAKGYLLVSFYRPLPFAVIEHVVGHVRKVWRYGFLGGGPLEGYISILRERNLGSRAQISQIDGHVFEVVGAAVVG